MSGYFKGQKIGTGTHTRKFWDERLAGNLSDEDWELLESKMTRSIGTCNTMGTASTMTALTEMLGMSLPGSTTRKATWVAPKPKFPRGYGAMYTSHVTQANEGCDFDFLQGTEPIPEPEIF